MFTKITACYILDHEIKSIAKDQTIGRQDILAGKKVQSIVAYSSGKTREGKTIANVNNAFLMLKELDGSKEELQIPLRSLVYDGGYPLLQFMEIGGRAFDWVNSKILFAAAPTLTEVVEILVVYER